MTVLGGLVRRTCRAVAVVFVVAVVSWLLAEAATGSAAERAARAAGVLPPDDGSIPAEQRQARIASVSAQFGLERNAPARLGGFVWGLAHLELGESWRDSQSVSRLLRRAAPSTLSLVLLVLLIALVAGTGLGVVAARRAHGLWDYAVAGAAALVFALPVTWLAIVGLRTFAAGEPWRWLPGQGLTSVGAWLLPTLCLAAAPTFVIARHTRTALLEAMAAEWAVATRGRGASHDRVLVVHALRVSLPTLLPLVAVLTSYVLGACTVVERVFGIHGLGMLLLDASMRADAPVIVGVVVVMGAVLATTSALTDALAVRLSPQLAATEQTR